MILVVVLVYGITYAWRAFPIISGYGAKNLCSCAYVSGREADSVINNELGSFPLSLGSFEIDNSDSSAYGSVFGLARRKAIYRKGFGCTLISEISEQAVRGQKAPHLSFQTLSKDKEWPFGDEINYDDSTINFTKLNAAIDEAFFEDSPEKPKNTRAIVVVHQGKVIGEKHAVGFDEDTPQLGWSMTKSITNALIGILVKQDKLDIYEPAPIAQWKRGDDPRQEITIDQLLRMSSGLEWEEEYAGPSTATNMLFKEASMGEYAASFPAEKAPDAEWYYSSGTSNILSMIVRESTAGNYYNFVHQELFSALGMNSAVMEPDASGTYVGSSYMYATPRDWAKFGLLYLNDGVWNGKRILPEGWAKYSSTPTPTAPNGEYGAHFWTNAGAPGNPSTRYYPDAPTNMYSLNGYDGQRVFILPDQDMVIVRLGLSKRGNFDFNKLVKSVVASIKTD